MSSKIAIIGNGSIGSLALLMAAQQIKEPVLHIIQHAHCAEPTEICPDCGNEVLVNKPSGAAFCIVCDYQRPGKLHNAQ